MALNERDWLALGHRTLDIAIKAIDVAAEGVKAYQERTDAEAHAAVEQAAGIKTTVEKVEKLVAMFRGHKHGDGGDG